MIGLSAKGERDEILRPVSDAAARALARPEAAGFRQSIVRDIKETFIPGPAGIFVPALVGNVDLPRFDRVISRIIKGIFYTERGVRLSLTYSVVSYSMAGLTRVPTAVHPTSDEQRCNRRLHGPRLPIAKSHCRGSADS